MEVLKRSHLISYGERLIRITINELQTKDGRLLEKKGEEIGSTIKRFLIATVTKKDRIQDPCWSWNSLT